MKPIETIPVARSRPPGSDAVRAVRNAPETPGSAAATSAEPGVVGPAVARSAGIAPPVDTQRVAEIRTALREGTYPLLPAKVADAMIAANYLLIEGGKD